MTQYRSFWESRGHKWPGRPRHGVWVTDGEILLLGVAVLLTQDGPYALVEGLATNPGVPARRRHEALDFCLRSLLDLAAMLDRTLIMTPSQKSKGVLGVAKRLGFQIGDTLPVFGGVAK